MAQHKDEQASLLREAFAIWPLFEALEHWRRNRGRGAPWRLGQFGNAWAQGWAAAAVSALEDLLDAHERVGREVARALVFLVRSRLPTPVRQMRDRREPAARTFFQGSSYVADGRYQSEYTSTMVWAFQASHSIRFGPASIGRKNPVEAGDPSWPAEANLLEVDPGFRQWDADARILAPLLDNPRFAAWRMHLNRLAALDRIRDTPDHADDLVAAALRLLAECHFGFDAGRPFEVDIDERGYVQCHGSTKSLLFCHMFLQGKPGRHYLLHRPAAGQLAKIVHRPHQAVPRHGAKVVKQLVDYLLRGGYFDRAELEALGVQGVSGGARVIEEAPGDFDPTPFTPERAAVEAALREEAAAPPVPVDTYPEPPPEASAPKSKRSGGPARQDNEATEAVGERLLAACGPQLQTLTRIVADATPASATAALLRMAPLQQLQMLTDALKARRVPLRDVFDLLELDILRSVATSGRPDDPSVARLQPLLGRDAMPVVKHAALTTPALRLLHGLACVRKALAVALAGHGLPPVPLDGADKAHIRAGLLAADPAHGIATAEQLGQDVPQLLGLYLNDAGQLLPPERVNDATLAAWFGHMQRFEPARLVALRTLDLGWSQVTRVDALQVTPNLTRLGLAGCKDFTDLRNLAHLPHLRALDLRHTAFRTLHGLPALPELETVDLRECMDLVGIRGLANRTQLREVHLPALPQFRKPQLLVPLARATVLCDDPVVVAMHEQAKALPLQAPLAPGGIVDVDGAPIPGPDITDALLREFLLDHAPVELDLSEAKVTDLSVLRRHPPTLRRLALNANVIRNFAPLDGLALEELAIFYGTPTWWRSAAPDLSKVRLPVLRKLTLHGDQATDWDCGDLPRAAIRVLDVRGGSLSNCARLESYEYRLREIHLPQPPSAELQAALQSNYWDGQIHYPGKAP